MVEGFPCFYGIRVQFNVYLFTLCGEYNTACVLAETIFLSKVVSVVDLLPALGGKEKTEEFFMRLSHMLVDYMHKQLDRKTKVSSKHRTKL